jgi:hypothetical protein
MRSGVLATLTALVALHAGSPAAHSSLIAHRVFTARTDSVSPLARFFDGAWHCRGGTPAGKAMEADVMFALSLDSRWLKSEHVDMPPGRYRSVQLWLADSNSARLTTTIYDNFGGARTFFGTWGSDSIVWVRDTSETGTRLERFTYTRTSENSYWYAWHVRRVDGAPVVLGDSATCRRR